MKNIKSNSNGFILFKTTFLTCKQGINDISYFQFPNCAHIICTKCLYKYLQIFTTSKIRCPSKGCTYIIPDNVVRKCLPIDLLEKYDKLCLPVIAKLCCCPGCPGVVAFEGKQGRYDCSICKQSNCLMCNKLHLLNERCGDSVNKKKYEEDGTRHLTEKKRLDLLELSRANNLIRNPDASDCENCSKFLLPREGILVSDCHHNVCRDCLKELVGTISNLADLKCLVCGTNLNHSECKELLGEDKLHDLCLHAVQNKFYHCQTPDCISFWDAGNSTGIYTCTKCLEDNCMGCKAVHKGLSCDEFKQTKQFMDRARNEELAKKLGEIVCFNCRYSFVKGKGCGAMKCTNCSKQVCAFTGLQVGPMGCKCTPNKPCHKDCKFGCIPD